MSVGNVGYSEGRAAPASIKREAGHRYLWLVNGITYIQKGSGVANAWVAEGSTSTKEYEAILNQNGDSAPTVTNVIKNTFGADPIITRIGVGDFRIAMPGVIEEKTVFTGTANMISSFTIEGSPVLSSTTVVDYQIAGTDALIFRTWDSNAQSLGYNNLVDGAWDGWNTWIRIEVPII